MSETHSNSFKLPVLTQDNFEEWFATVQSYARMLTVSSALSTSSGPDRGKEEKFWTLSHAMSMSVGKELKHLVRQRGKEDEWAYPSAIIKRIERELRPHATAQRHALKHEFFTLTLQDNKSIPKFIA